MRRHLCAIVATGLLVPALINSTLLELRAGLLERAEQKILRASELGTGSVLPEYARAFLERDRGHPESAAKILSAAHRDDPETVERLVKENRQRLRPEQLGGAHQEEEDPRSSNTWTLVPETSSHD